MTTLAVPLWGWAATIGALVLVLGIELVIGIRRGAHEVTMREAAIWTTAVVAAGALFGLAVGWLGHPAAASQFFAGWLTEYSLSLDNLFIFVLIIGRSAVPRALHSRILLLGVAMALVLRGSFIAVGASAISRFSWVLYLFGALLIFTAARLVFSRHQPDDPPADGPLLRTVKRVLPVTDTADGGKLLTRVSGRTMATPVLVVIIAIAATDLAFALDSIPAIFGLTRDPYLIFTANAFALMGLRQLYFLIGGLLSRLVYLSAGLAVILGFIGIKLIAEALAESGIHGVGPVPVPHISTGLSLTVIGGILIVTTVASLLASRGGPGGKASTLTTSTPSTPSTQPEAAETHPKAAETHPKAGETRPKAAETEPKAAEKRPKAAEKRPKAAESERSVRAERAARAEGR